MKIGDLVIVAARDYSDIRWLEDEVSNLLHLGVIVDEEQRVGSAGVSYKAFRVAWTNGERRWYNTCMLKPYKGYAGKKHNDIK